MGLKIKIKRKAKLRMRLGLNNNLSMKNRRLKKGYLKMMKEGTRKIIDRQKIKGECLIYMRVSQIKFLLNLCISGAIRLLVLPNGSEVLFYTCTRIFDLFSGVGDLERSVK